jgi:hypothetical protein
VISVAFKTGLDHQEQSIRACDRDVHFVDSDEELQRHAAAGHCVAVRIEIKARVERDQQMFVARIRSRYGEP